MIDKKLLEIIKSKKKTTEQAIYAGIKEIRKKHKNLISKEDASYIYATDIGIDVHKFLKNDPETANRILSLLQNNNGNANTNSVMKPKSTSAVITKEIRIKDIVIKDPLLPSSVLDDAAKLSVVYVQLYVFENSIRNFLKKVLDKHYPSGWWDEGRIGKPFDKANSRRADEDNNPWHGKRNPNNMLDYLDLIELNKVVDKNTDVLTPYFSKLTGKLDWLKFKIEEIYKSRCIIAHNNPLAKDDIERVKVICRDWQKMLPQLKLKLEQ